MRQAAPSTQQRGAFDHRGIDHLTLAGATGLEQTAHHPVRQEHAPTTEVADEVQRRNGCLAAATDRLERAGQRDVVDVVAGRVGVRAVLSPTGHPAVDELRIARQTLVRSEAESLGDPRAERFEQPVRLLHQVEHERHAVGTLQVDADRTTPALQHIGRRGRRIATAYAIGAIDLDDVRPHVGQHECAKRSRPDTGQFDQLDSRQRSVAHVVGLPTFDV